MKAEDVKMADLTKPQLVKLAEAMAVVINAYQTQINEGSIQMSRVGQRQLAKHFTHLKNVMNEILEP